MVINLESIIRLKGLGLLGEDWASLHKVEIDDLLTPTNLPYLLNTSAYSTEHVWDEPLSTNHRLRNEQKEYTQKYTAGWDLVGTPSGAVMPKDAVWSILTGDEKRRAELVLGCLEEKSVEISSLDSFILQEPNSRDVGLALRSFISKMSSLMSNLKNKSYGDIGGLMGGANRHGFLNEYRVLIDFPNVSGGLGSGPKVETKNNKSLDILVARGVLYFDKNFNAISPLRSRILAWFNSGGSLGVDSRLSARD